MSAYLERWADPAALSTLLGALIGALIAVCLWFAEKRRVEFQKQKAENAKSENFRIVLRSATNRLKRELEVFHLQCKSTEQEVKNKINESQQVKEGIWESVASFIDRFPVNVSRTLEFSETHLDALSGESIKELQRLKDLMQDFFLELRATKGVINRKTEYSEVIAEISELRRCAHVAISATDDLVATLQKGR